MCRAAQIHADFLSDLGKRATGGFAARKKFTSPIFNGIAVELRVRLVVDLHVCDLHE